LGNNPKIYVIHSADKPQSRHIICSPYRNCCVLKG